MDTSERRGVAISVTVILITMVCISAMVYDARRPAPGSTPAEPGAAAVRVDEASVNLPDVSSGAVVTYDFQLTNDSPHEIRLVVTDLSASCLEAQVSRSSFRPGEEASVSLIVDVADAAQFDVVAQVSCRVVGDGELPTTTVPLRLAGRVAAGQGLIPSAIRFGETRRGQGRRTQKFQLCFPEDASVNLLEVEPPSLERGLTIEIDSQPEMRLGKAVYSGSVVLDPDALNPGVTQIDEAVGIVVADDTTTSNFRLKVFGRVIDGLRATPDMLFWSRENAATSIKITLDAVDGQLIEIHKVTTEQPNLLRWTIRDNGDATPTLEIVCSLPDEAKGVIRSKITIHSEYGGTKETLILPVVVR